MKRIVKARGKLIPMKGACAVIALCAIAATALLAQPTFTTFKAPGAGTAQFQGTQAYSINAAGTIAGYYIDT